MTAQELLDQLAQLPPKKVQVGNQSVESHSLAELIALAELAANQEAAIKITKIKPGGAE